MLAFSRPHDTALLAARVLATSRDYRDRSYAAQALGIATRELGDVTGAIRHLRAALSEASRVGREREADVEASLGGTLGIAGRTAEALQHLDSAVQKARGVEAARVRLRRAVFYTILGRTDEAIHELRRTARALRAAGDTLWEGRSLVNLGQALIDGNDPRRAEAALARAEALLNDVDRPFDAAIARLNRGHVASLQGQIPEALAHYDAAETMCAEAGARPAELSEARCAALLAAGLYTDALHYGQEAVDLLATEGASAAYRANALVRAGDAALAAGDPGLARSYAEAAVRLYRRQGRARGETLARLHVARARYASGERSRRLLRYAAAVAEAADEHRVGEAIEAHLLTGQIALALHDSDAAERHLTRAASARSSGSALGRVLGWHAAALRSQKRGRRRTVLDACERGLQVLGDYQLTLGAVEMRAAATAHGASLALIAGHEAVAADDPRLLLSWTERWRATAFTIPPVRPPDDRELAADLAALRQLARRLDEATAEGKPTSALERERRRLEGEVRARTLRMRGDAGAQAERFDVDSLLDALGDTRLVEVLRLDDAMHVLVASKSGVRHHVAGSWQAAVREAQFTRFALRRLAFPMTSQRAQVMSGTLATTAGGLQRHILGAAIDDLGDGPLVVVPPAALHALPWGLLPALIDRAITVAPSALAWRRGQAPEAPRHRSVALVVGPGLGGGVAEVAALADYHADAHVLAGGTATVERVLAALEGRWLAHVAAHGTFRADNPLFSSLLMDDGPLTVHDLQRLRRAPYRVVLSCCDSGVTAATGADELLGLISALAPLGTAGLLAAVVPVNDAATVPVSLALHDRLAAGATTGEALRAARVGAREDPVAFATACAFVAYGSV